MESTKFNPELSRANPEFGYPEHRHHLKGAWHPAWRTHRDADEQAAHANLPVVADPRTPEQIKAKWGYPASALVKKVKVVAPQYSFNEYGEEVVTEAPAPPTEGELFMQEALNAEALVKEAAAHLMKTSAKNAVK